MAARPPPQQRRQATPPAAPPLRTDPPRSPIPSPGSPQASPSPPPSRGVATPKMAAPEPLRRPPPPPLPLPSPQRRRFQTSAARAPPPQPPHAIGRRPPRASGGRCLAGSTALRALTAHAQQPPSPEARDRPALRRCVVSNGQPQTVPWGAPGWEGPVRVTEPNS